MSRNTRLAEKNIYLIKTDWLFQNNAHLLAGRREVEGGDDAVGGEPALVDLLAMLAVVEEPAERDCRGVRVNLKIDCIIINGEV